MGLLGCAPDLAEGVGLLGCAPDLAEYTTGSLLITSACDTEFIKGCKLKPIFNFSGHMAC